MPPVQSNRTDKDIMKKYWFFQPDYSLQSNLMAFGWEVGEGWYPLIEELCDKIVVLFEAKYPDEKDDFQVFQVKEKYGQLCFYASTEPEEVFSLIREYEEKSASVCEECGKPGKERERGSWYYTRCDECWNEY